MLRFARAIPTRKDLDWCWYLRRQDRAGDMIERALHDIGVMEPNGWADWAPSALTQTGAPVELTFAEGETGLCVQTEIADPASDPVDRFAQTCRTMTKLGGTPPSAALRDVISAAQSTDDLLYGARIGLRTRGHALQTQIYAELPDAATDLVNLMWPAEIGDLTENCGAGTCAKMLCLDGTSGRQIMHFTAPNATASILAPLAAIAQLSEPVITDAIARVLGATDVFPIRQLSFSFAMQDYRKPPVLTLYLSAAELFGTDSAITANITERCTKPLPRYAGLIETLPRPFRGQTHHGMIGTTIHPDRAPSLSVNVAAPSFCPFELQ